MWLTREGIVIAVPPTGKGTLTVYTEVKDFLASRTKVGALAVAGVGSSALGSAAFARTIADALGV